MTFSWFDFVALILLGLGVHQGRKHGMSEELFPLLTWLTVVVGTALLYLPTANLLTKFVHITRYWLVVSTYIVIAFLLHTVFTVIRKKAKDQVQKIDIFGRLEYFLGMVSGALRIFCMIVVLIALFSSKVVTEEEVRRDRAFQEKDMGISFVPTRKTVQYAVVYQSAVGNFIRTKLPALVIQPDETKKP